MISFDDVSIPLTTRAPNFQFFNTPDKGGFVVINWLKMFEICADYYLVTTVLLFKFVDTK